MARGLIFGIYEKEGLYYLCNENKGTDQLRGYCEADLLLCFRICKNSVFSRRGSFYLYLSDEKFTGARVPPSLRGQSKRNCPSSWPGYSPGLFPAHLRGWGMGYGAWILMAGAIES